MQYICARTDTEENSKTDMQDRLDIVHCTGGFFATGLVAAGGAQFVFGFGVFSSIVHCFFTGIFGDIFCPKCEHSDYIKRRIYIPFTLAS